MGEQGEAFLDWLDREAEAFSSALSREHYLNYAGLKDDLELTPIFERHVTLFERATVDRVLADVSGDPRLPQLRELVADRYLAQAAKELTEEVARRETADAVEWDGREVPYRSLHPQIINEGDAGRRHQLDRRRLELTAAQNQLRERRWDLLYRQARDLGFTTYGGLCDEVGGLGLGRLRPLMERFLRETEEPYREQLAVWLPGVGIEPAQAERSDLLRAFRAPQFDGAFPPDGMLPALDGTLQGLGIDPAHQYNVHLDTEERPRKSPRAFCSAVRIPDEVYLVISPHGGHDDYRALFHEAGHAQHFAHVRRELPFAHRGLGDNSVTEGFAFVLEHLLSSPAWLSRFRPDAGGEGYLALVRFHKLYMLRRYGAKLLYEIDLHSGDDVRPAAAPYASLLSDHLGVRYNPVDYLFDLDDGFYCARYLRAWIFDAQVRAWFVGRWGDSWFAEPEAASALRELWSQGQRLPAEGLLEQLGYEGLDMAPLTAELTPGA